MMPKSNIVTRPISKVAPKAVPRAGNNSSAATRTKRSQEEMMPASLSEHVAKKLKTGAKARNAVKFDNSVGRLTKAKGTSWGVSKYSTVEEEDDRAAAAAVLQGLNRNTGVQVVPLQPSVASSSKGDRRQSGRMAQRRAVLDQEPEDGASPAEIGSTANARSYRAKERVDDTAAMQRLKLARKHQAAEWVRNLAATWTDVALGRECLLGLRSFEPISIKPEKRGNYKKDGAGTDADDERTIRRAAGAMKIVQAGLALPYSFGPDRGHTYHTVYLKKSVRGVGLKVRVIDSRVVVRGFASWFDSSRNNVRINDVIAAANAIDASSGRADRIMAEFNFKPPPAATEKISVGMSLVEETICVRLARPNIYADGVEEPRVAYVVSAPTPQPHVHVQAIIVGKDTELPKPKVALGATPVRVRIASSETSVGASDSLVESLPTSDKRATKIMIMPKVRVVPGVAKRK